ncbi:MAG: exonuclease domain-containing protein [Bacteroidota bacterium]
MLYTIVDIETTGHGIQGNKITEIALFKFDGSQIIDEFTSLVNPQCPIPSFITGLTGIDTQLVRDAPTFEELSDTLLQFTKDCIFVAHAVNFDYGVVKAEFQALGIAFVRKKLCTVRLSRKLIPGLQSYSLGKLCAATGIPLKDRHRARGDAHATVLLFQMLIAKPDSASVISKFLHARSQEATLPPLLKREMVDCIPNTPGIYYFKNQKGEIIYVGKAIHLKKRVLGHLYDKSDKEVRMCREIAAIDFELSGSELLALLMESTAIKRHYPKYNQAQKRPQKPFALFAYEDRRGILHLAYNTLKNVPDPLFVLYNPTDCRTYLQQLCETFHLCPKYCHLLPHATSCRHHTLNSCEGICLDNESITDYNYKVNEAITSLREHQQDFVIQEKGRYAHEKAVIMVKQNKYCGYGFIDDTASINSVEDVEAYITIQKNTVETERILHSYLIKKAGKGTALVAFN